MQSIYVNTSGQIEFVYDDELLPVCELGQVEITRASHVEPSPVGWTADMSPRGGPMLGPYATRGLALAAEREWLETQLSGV